MRGDRREESSQNLAEDATVPAPRSAWPMAVIAENMREARCIKADLNERNSGVVATEVTTRTSESMSSYDARGFLRLVADQISE
jgi:hypothetical protein